MNPRRLHNDTIFSISSWGLVSAITGRRVFGNGLAMSRNAGEDSSLTYGSYVGRNCCWRSPMWRRATRLLLSRKLRDHGQFDYANVVNRIGLAILVWSSSF